MKKILVLLFILNATFVYAGDGVHNLSKEYKSNETYIYSVYTSDDFIQVKSEKDKSSIKFICDENNKKVPECWHFMFEIIKIGVLSKWGENKDMNIDNIYLGIGSLNEKKEEKLKGYLNNSNLLVSDYSNKVKISIPMKDLDVFNTMFSAIVFASALAEATEKVSDEIDNATKEFEKKMNKAIDELNK